MKTVDISPAEMEKHIARFGMLQPQSALYAENAGIPREAYELMAAKTLYLLMAPETQGGPMAAKPAIVGDKGVSVIVAECPPGDRPLLHAHFHTSETFFCLKGRFRIRWGDEGQHETDLNQYDMISVPRGVCRDFTNVSEENALLLVIITGQDDKAFDDIAVAPQESRMMLDRFGREVIDRYAKVGVRFMGVNG